MTPMTREFLAFDGDYCCVLQIIADSEEPWKYVGTTVFRSAHCNGFCWSCRLRTAWRALRHGRVDADLELWSREDAERYLTCLHAAVDRVWPA